MSSRRRVAGTYTRPRIMYVLPSIDDDLDPDVKNALAIRNACATEGKCPSCDATGDIHPDAEHPNLWHLVFEHEIWCPVFGDAA